MGDLGALCKPTKTPAIAQQPAPLGTVSCWISNRCRSGLTRRCFHSRCFQLAGVRLDERQKEVRCRGKLTKLLELRSARLQFPAASWG
jgi:hypothetical protein